MALPADFNKVQVFGRYLDFAGNPMSGEVHFTPPSAVINRSTSTLIIPKVLVAILDATGYFSIELPATNDPDNTPTDIGTYLVEERFENRIYATYNIAVPFDSDPIDLIVAPRAIPIPVPTISPVTSVNGKTGVVNLTAADLGVTGGTGSVASTDITDSTVVGRSVLTAADAAAARNAIGAGTGTSSLVIGPSSTDAAAGNHTHTASAISDATAVGRSVLTATDAPAARSAIGAGTSSLTLGTGAANAAAGNHTHTAANITDATATGRSVLTAADAAAARTAIGAGTSNLTIGTTGSTAAAGNHTHTASAISDATAVGRSVLTAADAAAARSAIGAGTGSSNLALGTTSSTAAAGDHTHAAAGISDSTATGRALMTAADAAAARTAIGAGTGSSNLAIGTTATDAAAGNHTHTGYVPTSRTLTTSNGISGGGDLSANRTLTITYGTAANTVTQGNDSRVVNAILKTAQTLTTAEQTQVKTNIAAATVTQMTQAAYNALGTKDPNTLYVIVG